MRTQEELPDIYSVYSIAESERALVQFLLKHQCLRSPKQLFCHVSAAIKQHQKKASADGTGDEKRSLTSETVDDDVKTQALIEATKDPYDEVNVSQTILLLSNLCV